MHPNRILEPEHFHKPGRVLTVLQITSCIETLFTIAGKPFFPSKQLLPKETTLRPIFSKPHKHSNGESFMVVLCNQTLMFYYFTPLQNGTSVKSLLELKTNYSSW